MEQTASHSMEANSMQATPEDPAKVLVVEPHPTLRTVLVQRLRQDGHLTAAVGSTDEAIDLCREQTPDLLVSAELIEKSSALRLAQKTWMSSNCPNRERRLRCPSGLT